MEQNNNRQQHEQEGADILRDIGTGIEKFIKAGIGAVKSGMECSQETIDKWAEKGEPAFENAKSALSSAAGRLKKAVDDSPIPDNLSMMLGGKVTLDTLRSVLCRFTRQELDAVREMIDSLYQHAKDETQQQTEAQQPQMAAEAENEQPDAPAANDENE